MKKLSVFLASLLLAGITLVQAQTVRITGTVTSSEDGMPMPGVSVVVKGTTVGVITDANGKYELSVPTSAQSLTFSFVGFKTQEVAIAGRSVIDIVMETESVEVQEVVVTALGITRERKAVGYAVQDVKGEDIAKAREANVINSLSGKVAGINITASSGAVGASTRVELRGASSLTGSNQPLYVIDGVPIDNSNFSSASSYGGFDTPNGISDINPDDIETISVLKGPNAAALYGVRAANGVIVITTKKGKAGKKEIGVSFNSTTTFETPLVIPSFQNSYGQGPNKDFFYWIDGTHGHGGVDESWGPPLDRGLEFTQWNSYTVGGAPLPWVSKPDNVRNMYDTGLSTNNNLSFTGGTEKGGYRLSLGYMDQKGIIPGSNFKKYNVSGNANYNFTEKLSADFNIHYAKDFSSQLPEVGYTDENPIQQTIWSGRNVDFDALRDWKNLPLAPEGTPAAGTPINWNTQFQNNPFWVLDNNKNGIDKDRVMGAFSVSYKFNDNFSLRVKQSLDHYSYLTTVRKAIGTNSYPNGYYSESTRRHLESNSEILLSFNKDITSDINISFNLGGNALYRKYTRLSGTAPQLELPNLYTLSNVKAGVTVQLSNYFEEEKLNSIYGFGTISYKNALFLEFTGRNDWSSVLPKNGNSFFYPSVNLSALLTDLFEIESPILSYAKLRGGWSKVGGTGILGPYQLEQTFAYRTDKWGDLALLYNPSTLSNPNIKPEAKTSIEAGFDLRFLNNKVRLDATYYNMKSTDLIVNVEISAASGYIYALRNVGEMTNKGFEVMFGVTPIKTNDFTFDVDMNFYKNKNEVTSLGGLETLILGGQWNVDVQAREGEPYGVIFGPGYKKDPNGNIIHENGLPLVDSDYRILGNNQPDWRGGLTLRLAYKGLSLSTTFDAKMGGDIYTMTTTWGRYAGVLKETLIGRETGLVAKGVKLDDDGNYVPNNIVVSAKKYNQAAFDNSVAEGSIFDASYVKWRELVLSYNLPQSWFKSLPIKDVSLAFVGRNLAILYKNVPHIDPETAFSSSNGDMGMEFGQIPSVRSLGFNVSLKF
jgi:TonB-linked SusC/RagA family outer membrane protein